MNSPPAHLLFTLVGGLVASGCTLAHSVEFDAGAPVDASAPLDAGVDAGHDGGLDAEVDGGLDAGPAPLDGAVDAGLRCAEDEHVLEGVCVACPEGASNPAGDDPSGGDTECTDACAELIGFVCERYVEAYVKASNADERDAFGGALAFDGDTLVVGAEFEDGAATGVNGDESDDSLFNAGAVYVFARSGSSWTQQAYLKPDDPTSAARFGRVLALSGRNLAVVGGASVYLFRRGGDGATWGQIARLARSGASSVTGPSLALDGDTLAVGEESERVGGSAFVGAVHVYARVGVSWSEQATILAGDPELTGLFGSAVALDGNTLAVGARGRNGSSADEGAAYVFARAAGVWSQQALLVAAEPDRLDSFGGTLALEGDTLVVGATGEDSNATGVGGDASDNSAASAGAIYVFTRTDAGWTQWAYLKASNTDASDTFGQAVAISGGVIAVGAGAEASGATGLFGDANDDSQPGTGAVYLFRLEGTRWSPWAYLKAPDSDARDRFGDALALQGDTLIVSADGEDSGALGIGGDMTSDTRVDSGAAWVFRVSP